MTRVQSPRYAFPFTPSSRRPLTWLQRVKKWFYNHGKGKQTEPARPPVSRINFSKPRRKLVPLTPAQAYSVVFCPRGSALHKELREAWKLYTSADKATIEKYQHLFPANYNPNPRFVTFQQTILREKAATASEEELSAIQEYIDTRFQDDTNLRKNPWEALRVDDTQLDIDLEREYVKGYVFSFVLHRLSLIPCRLQPSRISSRATSGSLQRDQTCDQLQYPRALRWTKSHGCGWLPTLAVSDVTVVPHAPLTPSSVSSGETILTGQTFEQFLGPIWDVLKKKYWEWFHLSYSKSTLRVSSRLLSNCMI